jgi:hypothetical protein
MPLIHLIAVTSDLFLKAKSLVEQLRYNHYAISID